MIGYSSYVPINRCINRVDMAKIDAQAPPRRTMGIAWPFPPGRDCFAAWQAAMAPLCDCAVPAGSDIDAFDFHGQSWQLPEAFVQVHGGSGMAMSRSLAMIAAQPKAQLSLYMLTAGSVTSRYDGIERRHAPGEIVAIDYSHPYDSETRGFEGIAITFDKALAPKGFRDGVHGLIVTADSAAGAYLGAQIHALIGVIDRLDVGAAQAAIDGILRFAESVLTPEPIDSKHDEMAIFESAARLALPHLPDADFGPEALAIALNVSRSKLFRAFKEHGGVQRWLLSERLTASLHTIFRSAGGVKISAIAHEHGFRSEAHFSRAFHKRYQISPSTVRELATSNAGSAPYRDWVKGSGREAGSVVEAWLSAARVQQP